MTDTTTTDERRAARPTSSAAARRHVERPAVGAPSRSRSGTGRYVERYLVPLCSRCVVVVILVYVLNISRLFLSAHGHIPVIVGSVITHHDPRGRGAVAVGAAHAPVSAITAALRGFILSIIVRAVGSCSGTPRRRTRAALDAAADVEDEPDRARSSPRPGGTLKFAPNSSRTCKTGLVKIERRRSRRAATRSRSTRPRPCSRR